MVGSLIKVKNALLASYVDIGRLEKQMQKIKEAVKLHLSYTKIYQGLDPALLPSLIDSMFEFLLHNIKTRRFVSQLSGIEIKALCTNAILLSLKEDRTKVTHEDLKKAGKILMFKKKNRRPRILRGRIDIKKEEKGRGLMLNEGF
ncbi:hypothetical protein V6N13_145377 [Hibiscus sabdariffa]